MKNYSLLLLLFCCTLFTTACSDDDESTPSREQILQSKRWQTTSLSVSNILIGTIDYYATFETCQKDNFLEFKPNKVLIVDEGATKCNPAAPQQTEGTWTLSGDLLTLSATGISTGLPVSELKLTIKELTATSLTATFNESVSGFPVTGTIKMTGN